MTRTIRTVGTRICPELLRALIIGLFLCTSAAVYGAVIQWPNKVSGLDGWNGFELVKGKRCPVCYSLIFPPKFGLKNPQQIKILTELSTHRVKMTYDLDGPLFDDVDVLDHLLHLAVRYSDATAGQILLDPDKYHMLIGVDTQEDMAGSYTIPLIEGYGNLHALLEKKDYPGVARDICWWSAGQHDFGPANKLITNLKQRGYVMFAQDLTKQCGNQKSLMKKHGEQFAE